MSKESDRDDFKMMAEYLNESGTFLHFAALNKIREHGWDDMIEVPTSSAPFVSDPMKQPGAARDDVADPSMFPHWVSRSQNHTLQNKRTVDILASKIVNKAKIHLCVEAKKMDPRYVKLIFLNPQEYTGKFDVISKSMRDGMLDGMLDLMSTHRVWKSSGLCVTMDQLELDLGAVGIYNFGRAWAKKQRKGDDVNHLRSASNQAIEGTYGIILDSLVRQIVNSTDHVDEFFVPVVVTKADIYAGSYDPKNIDADSGTVDGIEFEKRDFAVYKCPTPAGVRFPNQVTGVHTPEQMTQSSRWTVLVANMKGLERILDAIDKSQSTSEGATDDPVGIDGI